jgi:tRNA threonylcarbamoyladenosine biosynthesis protein TsaE
MKIKTKSAKQTREYGKKLAKKIAGGGTVCLSGDLGAGKTTLVQGVAEGLEIKKRINSPTFIVARNYRNFWHIDLYRVPDGQGLGLEDIFSDSKNIVLIEWPEKITHLLPKHYWEIKITTVSETEREIHEIIH